MIRYIVLFFILLCGVLSITGFSSESKPVQHRLLSDVTNIIDAKLIFYRDTAFLKGKANLSPEDLHDIHMVTYSLEKSIAYFVNHFNDDLKNLAVILAEVVEDIHLSSENTQPEKTKEFMDKYFTLADKLSAQW